MIFMSKWNRIFSDNFQIRIRSDPYEFNPKPIRIRTNINESDPVRSKVGSDSDRIRISDRTAHLYSLVENREIWEGVTPLGGSIYRLGVKNGDISTRFRRRRRRKRVIRGGEGAAKNF